MLRFLRVAKMQVYVEYVLIDNFFIDLMLFTAAFKVVGKTVPRGRIIICSFIGAIFALLYPLITDNVVIISVVKVLFGLFLTFIAAKFNSVKEYLSFTAVFLGLTFFTGGVIMGVFSLLGLNVYSEFSVALMCLPVFLTVKFIILLVRYFYRKKDLSHLIVKAEIVCGEKSVILNGFFDTGNSLYDGFSPVIVASKNAVMPLLDLKLLSGAKNITVGTATGAEKKFSFKPDRLVIYSGETKNIFYNVRVCVVNKNFDGYDAILHPAFMEKKNDRKMAV